MHAHGDPGRYPRGSLSCYTYPESGGFARDCGIGCHPRNTGFPEFRWHRRKGRNRCAQSRTLGPPQLRLANSGPNFFFCRKWAAAATQFLLSCCFSSCLFRIFFSSSANSPCTSSHCRPQHGHNFQDVPGQPHSDPRLLGVGTKRKLRSTLVTSSEEALVCT